MNRLHRQLIGIFLVQNVLFNNNDFSMPFLLWNISHRLNQHNWKCLISFIRNCFYVLGYFFAALLHSVSIFIFFSVEFLRVAENFRRNAASYLLRRNINVQSTMSISLIKISEHNKSQPAKRRRRGKAKGTGGVQENTKKSAWSTGERKKLATIAGPNTSSYTCTRDIE